MNARKIAELPASSLRTYQCKDYFGGSRTPLKLPDDAQKIRTISNFREALPAAIVLAVDMPVLVMQNYAPEQFAMNGARGHVTKMYKNCVAVKLNLHGNTVLFGYKNSRFTIHGNEYMRAQIPLLPGYAITIHKSQSLTMDNAMVDLSGPGKDPQTGRRRGLWAHGQAYTALSRVSTLKGLHLVNLEREAFVYDPDLIAWYKTVQFEKL